VIYLCLEMIPAKLPFLTMQIFPCLNICLLKIIHYSAS
jgi:hypothetical protein